MSSANGAANSTSGQTYDHMFKLVMIGEAGVGKSSILLRFTDDRFDEDHLSTIGVDLRVKFVDVNKKKIKMVIWDTAGQERFRTLASSYYHKIQGVVLVYDVTRRETFDSLDGWNREVDVNTDGAPVVRVLVGNKIDESDKRQVSRKEGEAWAHEHSMLFVESSAKTRAGIQQVFLETIMRILDNSAVVQSAAGGQSTVLGASSTANPTRGGDSNENGEANSGCC